MPENQDFYFTSKNLDSYLKELAKEYRRLNGDKLHAEITLVGGAAILANYGFRNKTYDMDVIVRASSVMKDAATHVGDRFELPHGWFNSDFMTTSSYSSKLETYSKPYKTFSNIVHFRTVSAEYLVAMKLMAGRPYKNDLSDVAEIIAEHQRRGNALSYDLIIDAVKNLYGDAGKLPETSLEFLLSVFETEDINKLIAKRKELEQKAKAALVDFEQKYEGVLNEDNLSEILAAIDYKEKQIENVNFAGTITGL